MIQSDNRMHMQDRISSNGKQTLMRTFKKH